jgi:hypothetical protein
MIAKIKTRLSLNAGDESILSLSLSLSLSLVLSLSLSPLFFLSEIIIKKKLLNKNKF